MSRPCELLVDGGADVDIADRQGVTPRAHAERAGYDEIVAILDDRRPLTCSRPARLTLASIHPSAVTTVALIASTRL